MLVRLLAPLLTAVFVLGLLLAPVRADAALQETVTARLGISAGDAIQDLPRGTAGRVLAERIAVLYEMASAYGVRIVTVSVGQGFWSEDGEVMAENDLDLVVSGTPENVNAVAATLGMTWGQSVVLVWHGSSGSMATATIPLPGGTDGLTPDVYQALIAELVDGGHVKYAGANSVLFVAKTGDEPD